MKSQPLTNRKVQFAFVSAILVLLMVGAISYRGIVVSNESDLWVRHTHEVLESLRDLGLATESAKAGSGGFVMTGLESYADVNHASLISAERARNTVRTLTLDNPRQQQKIPELEDLGAQQAELSEKVISLRRTHGMDAALAVVRIGQGNKITDEVQRICREMQDEELRLLPLRNADAQRRLMQNKAILIFGTLLGLVIVAAAGWRIQRDDAKGSRAREALRGSEEKYRMLLDGIHDYAIYMLDPKGMIVSWNAGAERIKGYTTEEIIGKNFSCFYPPEEIEKGKPEEVLRLTTSNDRYEEQGMRVRKDGSQFLASVTLTALRNPSGFLQGFSEISRDLTERSESEVKYRGLLEAAPDAMVVVNQTGEIVLLNAQAENQFGYHRDELLGQKVKNIIPEGFAERLITDATRTVAEALAQQIGTGIELSGRRKDGTEFPIEIMLSPLESPDGILVTAAIRDISVRRAAEELLVKTVGDLKRSNEELQQFAYVASHDLQEPLRMVASYTQLLEKRYKGQLDSDANEFIAFAVDGCNRMKGLIEDLLAYSRAGMSDQLPCRISGENALGEALTNLRAAVEESGAVVTHDALPTVTTNSTQLTQIFQNLVGNAIKYRGPEPPDIHVSAIRNGGNEWTFSIRDNGMGIDPQYFERIFVIFQRLHGREEFEGTGIGLAVCKKIVEQIGGRIWVESQIKKGSTFYFTLPERDGK
jgi:PAS domain S-box-containing protein